MANPLPPKLKVAELPLFWTIACRSTYRRDNIVTCAPNLNRLYITSLLIYKDRYLTLVDNSNTLVALTFDLGTVTVLRVFYTKIKVREAFYYYLFIIYYTRR